MKRKYMSFMLVVIVSLSFVFSYGVYASETKYDNPIEGWDGPWQRYGFSAGADGSYDAATGDIKIAGIVSCVASPSANVGYYQFTTEFDVESPGVAMFVRGVWENTADGFSVLANYLNGIYVIPNTNSIDVVFGTGTNAIVHSFNAPNGYSLDNVVTITIKDNSEAIFVYANNSLVCAIDLDGVKTHESAEYYESVVLIKPTGEIVETISGALVAKSGNYVGYAANTDGSRVRVKSYTINSETFEDKIPTPPETGNPQTSDNTVIGSLIIVLMLLAAFARKKVVA